MKRGRTNGRVGHVREYLARVKTARSPEEIRRAVEPTAAIGVICNTLSYMAQRGYVEQLGHGKGKARFRIGKQAPPAVDLRANGTQHIVSAAPAVRRAKRSNFHAAPGTVSDRPRHLMSASERIAADIAAFQARGGKIEVLGITQVFHTYESDNDD
ncbi:MAG TPA: hypothetical protein VM619_14655 [Luteimonas sp.]|nr:hypothetical protein [Luteimonas sp.]